MVLDIGSGLGYLCRPLALGMQRVVGVGGSPAKIARAPSTASQTYIESMFDERDYYALAEADHKKGHRRNYDPSAPGAAGRCGVPR